MQKFEVVAQLYIMPHPHLKIVLRLMTHRVDSGGVKGYNVNPLIYSLWFNKRELCRTTTISATTTRRAACRESNSNSCGIKRQTGKTSCQITVCSYRSFIHCKVLITVHFKYLWWDMMRIWTALKKSNYSLVVVAWPAGWHDLQHTANPSL